MPKLRLSYAPTKKSRGAKSKSPTSGCTAYAAERRGWKNKVKKLERHLKRVAVISTSPTADQVAVRALEKAKKAVKGLV